MRYVLVSGGVISGVGKGIIASSTGLLLKSRGLRISCIKIDPYVSYDAGLMSPAEHGECFVLGSGDEVDLDLGNYERYLSVNLTGQNNVTTGKIYHLVFQKERRGDYLGKTVQIVPHITDALKAWFRRVASTCVDGSGEEPDVCIIELGGTVGDIESLPFIEALSQLRHEVGSKNFLTIHVTYVPTIHGETKTKPTQHAVKQVRSYGLIPDIVACRCKKALEPRTVDKLALHCQVENNQILVVRDMPTIYQVPILLRDQNLLELLDEKLDIGSISVSAASQQQGVQLWQKWTSVVTRDFVAELNIVLVGKYVETPDAYLSVVKSLEHSSMRIRRRLNLVWVDAEHLEPKIKTRGQEKYDKAWQAVHDASGIIVPGGFGRRGTEGMMLVSQWAREQKRPFLGVCLGFQVAVIQLARDFCGMPDADSTEFDKDTPQPVVINMPELDQEKMGGTMRLGSRVTIFQDGTCETSKVRKLYGGAKEIHERHRHRYEVNPEFVDELEKKAGLRFVGKDDTGKRMEVFELDGHPYFVGTQFHAEYQSRVLDPSRPYLGFIAASAGCLDQVIEEQAAQLVNGSTHF